LHPILIKFGWFYIPTYGTLLVLAILGGIFIAVRLGRRESMDSGLILDFCTWVILVALVGAKVLMVVSDWTYFRAHPSEIFSFSTLMAGGVFYGGFLAAFFFTIWYVRVQKLSFWKLTDVLAPGVALGQSVGRLGCFSAGCDYGTQTSAPWGVVFTNTFAHDVGGVPLGVRLHPTQLYESLATFAIFGLLLWWFPKKRRDGEVFIGYVGLYALARFFLEFLRGDEDRGFVFNHLMSTSQFIALLALAGIAALTLYQRVHRGEGLSAASGSSDERSDPQAGGRQQESSIGRVPTVAATSVPKR
jgi:phosphatidylglycerol:prolipoprotein diacylglycerol transferase